MTAAPPSDVVEDNSLQRPDGRVVAWTECGVPDGRVLLRMPGTPGCRYSVRSDRSPWIERGLRVVTTERPGFGASTPWPDRGHDGPADDVAAILDHLGVDSVALTGGSGGGPHVLAFCARHPDRVQAATVTVGAAPIDVSEIDQMIELNAKATRFVKSGDLDGLRALEDEQRAAMLADPLASFRAIMGTAPAEDQSVMADPAWQESFAHALTEALRQGVDGWFYESLVFEHNWDEIDFDAIKASITWWASDGDRNVPLSAIKRLLPRLPTATLNVWTDGGHFTPYHREGEILDELLARCAG